MRRLRVTHGFLWGLALVGLGCAPKSPPPAPTPSSGLPTLPVQAAAAPSVTAATSPVSAASVSTELPSLSDFVFARQERCAAKSCALKSFAPSAAYAETPGQAAVAAGALFGERLEPDAALSVPRSSRVSLALVVLAGTASLALDDGTPARPLATWDAVVVPEAGVTLATGSTSALLLVLLATTDRSPIAELVPDPKPARRASAAARAISVHSLSQSALRQWGSGAFAARVALAKHGSAPHAAAPEKIGGDSPHDTEVEPVASTSTSISLLMAAPGKGVPPNVHSDEWEHIAILSGDGAMLLAGNKYPIRGGEIFHVPKGTEHGFESNGTRELKALLFFTPAGPEQRFIDLGSKK
jgi:mannose-6-phosphate isomerase-like protein (cupin superfamily)